MKRNTYRKLASLATTAVIALGVFSAAPTAAAEVPAGPAISGPATRNWWGGARDCGNLRLRATGNRQAGYGQFWVIAGNGTPVRLDGNRPAQSGLTSTAHTAGAGNWEVGGNRASHGASSCIA